MGVKLIDDQHKKIFDVVCDLIDALSSSPTRDQIEGILNELIEFKQFHFATEEKYFDEFDYELKEEHKMMHKEFNDKLELMLHDDNSDLVAWGYRLSDYLDDWLNDHIMNADEKFVTCFREHGLN